MEERIRFPYEYDPVKRKLSKIYTKQKIIQASIISVIIPLAFFSIFILTGMSEVTRSFSTYLSQSWYVPIYLSILFGLLLLIITPFSFYFGYVFEKRYGLSKQTVVAWFTDHLKIEGLLFLVLILGGVGLHFIWDSFPSYWWIIASVCFFGILLFIGTIFPILLIPFLWKTEDFKDEARKRKLADIAKKSGIGAVDKVIVVKESEKSKKVNAGLTGFGKTRSMFIFDNLLNKFPPKEIDVIFAHEMGHHVKNDVIKGMALSSLLTFSTFFVIAIVIMPIASSVGIQSLSDIAIFPLFAALFIAIQIGIRPIKLAYSRKRERLADQFALDTIRDPEAQISAFKRLADIDLADDSPHSSVEAWLFSHPSINRRIRHCETWKAKRD